MKGCLYTEMNKNVSHTCVRVILRLQWLRRRKNLTFKFRNEPDLRVMYRHAPVSMSAWFQLFTVPGPLYPTTLV